MIRTGDHITHNPVKIANAINKFFVTVASKYQSSNDAIKDFVLGRISSAITFDIHQKSHSSVFKHLSHLLPTKAPWLNGIRARRLRAAAPVITEPLVKIINLCIWKRVYLNSWKLAKVMPVFKVGDHRNVPSYRPISILPVMSKIFERHVHVALYEYLNQYVLLFKYQTCFRPFYSCETAVIDLVEGLLMNLDNGLLTGLSLIDFRKAFDFVDHGVLLRNLSDSQLLE